MNIPVRHYVLGHELLRLPQYVIYLQNSQSISKRLVTLNNVVIHGETAIDKNLLGFICGRGQRLFTLRKECERHFFCLLFSSFLLALSDDDDPSASCLFHHPLTPLHLLPPPKQPNIYLTVQCINRKLYDPYRKPG